MRLHKNQTGSAVISLLVTILVAVVGFGGYYVWHTQHAKKVVTTPAKSTTTTASTTPATTTSPAPAPKYLTITEWDVRAPYSGSDTLTYKMNTGGNSITVISKNLADNYGCTDFGAGGIARLTPDTIIDPGPDTAAQAAQADPSSYAHIGNYYYDFSHDQAACGNISAGPPGSPTAGEQAQSDANNLTQSLISKLEAIPAS